MMKDSTSGYYYEYAESNLSFTEDDFEELPS